MISSFDGQARRGVESVVHFAGSVPPLIPVAETRRHITFSDYLNNHYSVQHENGPGNPSFNTGDAPQFVVTNGPRHAGAYGVAAWGGVLGWRAGGDREERFLAVSAASR